MQLEKLDQLIQELEFSKTRAERRRLMNDY